MIELACFLSDLWDGNTIITNKIESPFPSTLPPYELSGEKKLKKTK